MKLLLEFLNEYKFLLIAIPAGEIFLYTSYELLDKNLIPAALILAIYIQFKFFAYARMKREKLPILYIRFNKLLKKNEIGIAIGFVWMMLRAGYEAFTI